MKKILIVLIVLGGGYYYFQGNGGETLTVSELLDTNSQADQSIVKVTGKVENNFKLIYSVYQLKDSDTGESIMVITRGELPKVGSIITKQIRRKDVVTLNDKTFSLFQEID